MSDCTVPTTPLEVANTLLSWVEESLPGSAGVEVRDRNDGLLVGAYGRAYRCFTSIRELAARHEADDAWILARALLSIALQSLWLVQPEDLDERERRFRRAGLSYFLRRKTIAAEEQAAGVEVGELTPERFQKSIECLEAEGLAPMPNDHDLAVALDLKGCYTRVYRGGSEMAHYSIGAALDGFLELTHGVGIGPVALQKPDQARAEDALAFAVITYGVFIHLTEPVLKHGLGRRARDLIADMVRELAAADAPGTTPQPEE